MSRVEYDVALAAFLRNKRITRCPTVCVVPTRATVTEADRAAYRAYVAERDAAREKRQKAILQMLQG